MQLVPAERSVKNPPVRKLVDFFARSEAPHVTPPPAARSYGFAISAQAFLFSQGWLATPQLVLQALWQEVWHSPQPPLTALSQRLRVSRVFILFIVYTPF